MLDRRAGETVDFQSGGAACVGQLWKPAGPGPFPVVIFGAGLGGTRELKLDVFARRFAGSVVAAILTQRVKR